MGDKEVARERQSAMRIDVITVENIGNFSTLSVKLSKQVNIVCGPNGVGKSNLLGVIADAFSGPNTLSRKRAGSKSGSWEITGSHNDKTLKHKRIVEQFSPEDIAKFGWDPSFDPVYFINFRASRDITYKRLPAIQGDRSANTMTYHELASRGVSNKELKSWLVNRALFLHMEKGLSEIQRQNFTLALELLSALDQSVKFDRVDPSSLDIFVVTPAGSVYLEYLSSGFRSVYFILLGLIKEIEFRTPEVPAIQFGGVILIDEIDLHLHPSWQGKIIEVLRVMLPRCQFIVSTHSPHVIQSANPAEVIALRETTNGGAEPYLFDPSEYGFIGWTIEEILTEIMGVSDTRTAAYEAAIASFNTALDKGNAREIQTALDVLDGMLHPSNPLRKVLRIQAASLLAENDQT
jgi:predicted ATPase